MSSFRNGWLIESDGTKRRPQIADFLRQYKVDNETGCHIWTGRLANTGYGRFMFGRRWYSAHRAAYEKYKGAIPSGLLIRHSCHNRSCINPAHLTVGTHADNARDMIEAGRSLYGTRNIKNRLSEEDVQRIKELLQQGYRTCTIAKMFNMSWGGIAGIKNGKNWKHLA